MKNDRLGLLMIAASLVVIGVTMALFLEHDRENRLTQIREQGVSLTQLLSKLSLERLASPAHGLTLNHICRR